MSFIDSSIRIYSALLSFDSIFTDNVDISRRYLKQLIPIREYTICLS